MDPWIFFSHFLYVFQRNYITDNIKIWNLITLRLPTDAPTELADLYMDQVSLLNIIWEADKEATENNAEEVCFSYKINRS